MNMTESSEQRLERLERSQERLLAENDRLRRLLWTPINERFLEGVMREAGHQVERWGVDHDAGKEPQDWFWLIGYLAGKALRAAIDGDQEKALHHTISTAAVCANWHGYLKGEQPLFRPGLGPDRQETKPGAPE